MATKWVGACCTDVLPHCRAERVRRGVLHDMLGVLEELAALLATVLVRRHALLLERATDMDSRSPLRR
jgi:hypothetical protein